MSTKITWTGN